MDPYTRLIRLNHLLCTNHNFDTELKDLVSAIAADGNSEFVISAVREFSSNFLLARSDVLLSTLALCATLKGGAYRKLVYGLVPKICRIPTDLFKFLKFEADFSQNKKGSFGRSKRRMIAQWYNSEVKTAEKLAMLMTKYRKRSGWSHADVLRLAHIKPVNEVRGLLFKYALKGYTECQSSFQQQSFDGPLREEAEQIMTYLQAVETVRHSHCEEEVTQLIREHDLLQEHVPTWLKHSKQVWKALLEKMPLLAMIKSVNNLTAVGLLDAPDTDNCVQLVKKRLDNEEYLKHAKIHPFNLLIAWKTYESGHGEKGSLEWKPNRDVIASLNNAFNLSFKTVSPTCKRYLLAIDCCQMMEIGGVMGVPSVTPLLASAAMAMTFTNSEPSSQIVLLSSSVRPIPIPKDPSLEVLHSLLKKQICTDQKTVIDCSCPMTWAAENLNQPVDMFVIYTCNNGQGTAKTPAQALQEYREKSKRPARLAIVTLTCPAQSPNLDSFDSNVIYLSGFDASVHEAIRSFSLGRLDLSPGG